MGKVQGILLYFDVLSAKIDRDNSVLQKRSKNSVD